jgi:glucokinase
MILPFPAPQMPDEKGYLLVALAGDIGATKTNLACYQWIDGNRTSLKESTYQSAQHNSILEILELFLDGMPAVNTICLAVAGPVVNDKASLTNLHWEINRRDITTYFKTENVFLVNDLEANAYGLAVLEPSDLYVVHQADQAYQGNAAIISPGTGLGEAGLFWDGKFFHPFATEGGHGDFAARDSTDTELLYFLGKKFGHVSWERMVCGPGIVNIYQFLKDVKKMDEPGWLKDKIADGDMASVISEHIDRSGLCDETIRLFFRYLAHESANLVLKLNATGGLFIGGGIAPKLISCFDRYQFFSAYCNSGRLNFLLEKVSINVIMKDKAALLGAAFFAQLKFRSA